MFEVLEVPVEDLERLVLVVLAGDIGAVLAETVQQFFGFLGGDLDIRPHTLEEFLAVHLCPGISNDPDVLREKLVAELYRVVNTCELGLGRGVIEVKRLRKHSLCHLQDQTGRGTIEIEESAKELLPELFRKEGGGKQTVFFFARSPEAPRTTMAVLSLSSVTLE